MFKFNLKFLSVTAASLLISSPMVAAELKLKNGTPLIVEQDARSPRDIVVISFLGGNGLIKPQEQGVGAILTGILNEGPVGTSSADYRKELFLLAGQVSFSVSARSASVTVIAPADKLKQVTAIAMQTLKNPKFDAETYKIARSMVDTGLQQREDDMASTLRYFAMRDAYSYHPDVLDGSPSRLSLKNVTIETVKKSLPLLYNPASLLTAAVGPTDGAAIQTLLDEQLGTAGYLAKPSVPHTFTSARSSKKPTSPAKIVLIDRPGATDNQLRYITRANLPIDNADQVALDMAMTALGGGMQGSLFKVLRAERGLTYSAGAGANEDLGYWSVASFTSIANIEKLMKGIDEVVSTQAKVAIDKPAADLLKRDLVTQWKEGRELPSDQLSEVVSAKIHNRDLNFQQTYDQLAEKTAETEITRLGKATFSLKDARIYIMGDKSKLLPIFKKMGYKGKDVRVVEANQIL